jgi:hypothetical protein
MAYFARLKEDNVVDIVVAIPDEFETEPTEYLTKYWGEDGNWIKTSFTNSIRGVFAKTGYTYDPVADVFIASEPTEETPAE